MPVTHLPADTTRASRVTTLVPAAGLLSIVALGTALLASAPAAQTAAPPREGQPEKLGTVDFPISCNASAQAHFTRAMALKHSYHWVEAKKGFQAALAVDPGCAMAHWGLAIVAMDNAFLWPIQGKALSEGLAHIDNARAAGARTERERDYIAAADAMYRNADKVPARTRQLAYELALEKMTRDYPNDIEAKVLHALVMSANFNPADKTYANQHRAADILEKLYVAYPDHPGVAHYLIHTYDYPPLAKRGLNAAYRYRDIAPSAPHALHMPSHIFTRLGLWADSVASNRSVLASTKAAQPRLHSLDYMAYAHLQMGQDRHARAALDEVQSLRAVPGEGFGAAYALAAIPARMAIERGRWADAARLTLHPGELDFGWAQYPQAQAINAYARAIGAARSGQPAAARLEIERLGKLREDMVAAKLSYWVEQADVQIGTATAWALFAEGARDEALRAMRAAADREDATEKNVVTPGPIKPARELLGDMLALTGRAGEALAAYEKTLENEPNRFHAMLGAAQASEAIGDKPRARLHYGRLLVLWQDMDEDRTELRRAREVLAVR